MCSVEITPHFNAEWMFRTEHGICAGREARLRVVVADIAEGTPMATEYAARMVVHMDSLVKPCTTCRHATGHT